MRPDCEPTCDRAGHQGTFRKGVLFCSLLFIFGYCGAGGVTLILFRASFGFFIFLFCTVQYVTYMKSDLLFNH